jgi:Tol biopolymer transport system component
MHARGRHPARGRAAIFAGALVVAALVSGAQAGRATFSGLNGPIVFVSTRDGNTEIYRMNGDGSGQTRLTNDPGLDAQPSANRGGSKILFVSNRDGSFKIYVMNADGSGVTRLTDGPGADALPVYSPDGSRIVFLSNREGGAKLFVMNADGSGVTRLTDGPDFEPAWSPSGNAIAFRSARMGQSDIYQVRPDGSGLTRLTENPAEDFAPDYSPDGKQLLFSSNRGGPFELYVLDLPAGVALRTGPAGLDDNPTKVTDRPNERKSHGNPSPDGMHVVFEGQPAGRTDFQLIRKPLAGGPETERVLTEGAGNSRPFWVATVPPPPKKCTCKSLTVDFLPTLLKNNRLQPDRHDFGIGFQWTLRCTKGAGECDGAIKVLSPQVFVDKVKQPPGALKIAADSFQFACKGPCGAARTRTVKVKMISRDQLTKLIGQEFAFEVRTVCAGKTTPYRVRVLVDSRGRPAARVTRLARK